ncbi:MAG: NAD(+)/NADH kinase [Melioribacteraceae bacterium]|nr:NAD(+)/NADH kinase [Melioribacteraceae bacterium]MCF8265849.1 NAD(+)/NADH kinase [Melioribacteraceae bacterium]MCF8411790.1 NAD(+)/NADH kinase [Melioribacteraceae bacterium]
MTIGLVPNSKKENVDKIILDLINKLDENNLEWILSDTILETKSEELKAVQEKMSSLEVLCQKSDFIFSIGGDGTMLNTAYAIRNYSIPIVGINIGKLGFLAEFDMLNLDGLIAILKTGEYSIEERIALQARSGDGNNSYFAVNDFVIDKGKWPKMIEILLKVDDDYVSSFSADGIIIATPTGSTGYSLSTGGPIVSPKTKAFTISPISPHSLNMRPLVVSDDQKIELIINSLGEDVQLSSDGQRVYPFTPPIKFVIKKSETPIRLVHSNFTNYYEILRKKLFWGLDIRSELNNRNGI